MKINRKPLYVGVFLVAAGAVLLANQAGLFAGFDLGNLLQLWPLAIVAFGVALLVRGTRAALAAGVVAAVLPGLLLGGLVAAAPRVGPPCADWEPAALTTQQGSLAGSASVDLRLACGDLTVTTTPGTGWELQSGAWSGGNGPHVDASNGRLSIESSSRSHGWNWGRGGETWKLALPTGSRLDLTAEVDAGSGTLDLAGAQLGDVRLSVNAADARLDLAGASADHLSLDVNAAAASVYLPSAQDLTAEIDVNAGAVKICAASDVGVRIHHTGALSAINEAGLLKGSDTWQTANYASAAHHADVTVTSALGSVDVNPVGGCK